jgi:hypothetical protein
VIDKKKKKKATPKKDTKRKRDDAADESKKKETQADMVDSGKRVKFSEAPKLAEPPTKKSGVSTSARASATASDIAAADAKATLQVAPQVRLEFARLNEWYEDALRRANAGTVGGEH